MRFMGRATDHFDQVVRAYSGELFHFALWLCRDRHRAEDVLQEALTRAWRRWGDVKDEAARKSWLYTIVRNEYYREAGKSRRQEIPMDDEVVAQIPDERDFTRGLEVRQLLMSFPAAGHRAARAAEPGRHDLRGGRCGSRDHGGRGDDADQPRALRPAPALQGLRDGSADRRGERAMTELEARRLLMADPRRPSPELREEIARHPALAEFHDQLLDLDRRTHAALTEAPLPHGLADRLVLGARYRRVPKARLAIAAAIAGGRDHDSLALRRSRERRIRDDGSRARQPLGAG
jgi:RNA polymerase sigma factor (sigma-70 family)